MRIEARGDKVTGSANISPWSGFGFGVNKEDHEPIGWGAKLFATCSLLRLEDQQGSSPRNGGIQAAGLNDHKHSSLEAAGLTCAPEGIRR
jgi:hypothetical protein